MPRPARKQRRHVVDVAAVLDQPITALASAIAALRGRAEGMADSEVVGVAREAGALLHRCIEAQRADIAGDVIPACVGLLLDAVWSSPDAEKLAVESLSSSSYPLNDLHAVFLATVSSNSPFPVDVQVDVLELVQLAADAAETKERTGELFMQRLAELLADSGSHFSLQRAVCTAIINLVKCSKANKLRLPSYTPVCRALCATTDYFLQLQCVEVLYRVTRQNRHLLDAVADELPAELVAGIKQLPNTAELFHEISAMLTAWNESRDPRLIIDFGAKKTDVGTSSLTGPTRLYFSPEFVMVMIPNTAADNVTIEYTRIRSVRLGKDNKVMFRLREPPLSIADRITVNEEGKDALTVQFDAESLAAFKQSRIQSWIFNVLKELATLRAQKPADVSDESMKRRASRAANNVTETPRVPLESIETPDGFAGQPGQQPFASTAKQLQLDDSSPLQGFASMAPAPQPQPQPAQRQPSAQDREGATRPLFSQRSGSRALEIRDDAKRTRSANRLDDDRRPDQPSPDDRHGTGDAQQARTRSASLPMDDAARQSAALALENPLDGMSPVSGDAAAMLPPPNRPRQHQPPQQQQQPTQEQRQRDIVASSLLALTGTDPRASTLSDSSLEDMMGELQTLIEQRVQRKRDEAAQIVGSTLGRVQQMVDETRDAIRRDVDAFQGAVSADVATLRDARTSVARRVEAAVADLGGDLKNVKATGQMIHDSISAMDIEFCQVTAKTRGMEEEKLRQIKMRVDAEIASLEGINNQRIAAANPVRHVKSFLARKFAEEDAAAAGTSELRLAL